MQPRTENEDVCVDSGCLHPLLFSMCMICVFMGLPQAQQGSVPDWGGRDFPGPESRVRGDEDEGPAHCGEGKQKQAAAKKPPSVGSPENRHRFHVLTLFHTIWWVLSRAFTVLPLVISSRSESYGHFIIHSFICVEIQHQTGLQLTCFRVNNAILKSQGGIRITYRMKCPQAALTFTWIQMDLENNVSCHLRAQFRSDSTSGIVLGYSSQYGKQKHACNLWCRQMCFNLCLPGRWEEPLPSAQQDFAPK